MHLLIKIEMKYFLLTKQSDPLHFNEVDTLSTVRSLLKLKQSKYSLR